MAKVKPSKALTRICKDCTAIIENRQGCWWCWECWLKKQKLNSGWELVRDDDE